MVSKRERSKKDAIPCEVCGQTYLARRERTHDICRDCQRKRQSERQKFGAEVELDHWQVDMYLDAMIRNEMAPPWAKRKIR